MKTYISEKIKKTKYGVTPTPKFFGVSSRSERGFTIIELLITISIVVVISSVILINYPKFSNTIKLNNLAYDIALSIREAQTYGINVRGFESNFDVGYGIHFKSDNSWILFADKNRNSKYDVGDGIVETFNLQGGFTLSEVYARTTDNFFDVLEIDITHLDITFDRPNPDANFTTSNTLKTYQDAQITVMAPDGVSTRSILINTTGFISIQ